MSKSRSRKVDNDDFEDTNTDNENRSESSSSSESSSNSSRGKNKKKRDTFEKQKAKLVCKKKRESSSLSLSPSSLDNVNKGDFPSNLKKKHAENNNKTVKYNRQDRDDIGDKYERKRRLYDCRDKDEGSRHTNLHLPTEYSGRSKWDSPNRELRENEHDRRKDYNRNKSSYYRDDRNQDRHNLRRENVNRGRQNWRDRNCDYDRFRYERTGQDNRRNYKRRDRFRDNDRSSQERRSNSREETGRAAEQYEKDQRRSRSQSPRRPRKFPRKSNEDNKAYEWGKEKDNDKAKSSGTDEPAVEKTKPDFGLSGKLAEDTNKVNGIVIKYAEPPEARKPKRRWRLYPFKGEKALPTLYIHRQSCYLIGRDRKICDLPVDHPSCSKQHAVLQYRLVPFEREDGTTGKRVRPYLIDLESANGTFINNKPIEAKKYFELLEKDVIKFGFSSREYVLLHENSKEEDQDDDVFLEDSLIKEEKIEKIENE